MTLLWRVALTVGDIDAAEAGVTALDGALATLSAFEAGSGWLIEGLSTGRPDRAALEARLMLAWTGRSDPLPPLTVERLPARDWVSENQAGFPPVAIDRYFVHGTHYRKPLPPGRVGLLIDAATAFGTGEHATTRGCLLALAALARQGRRRRVLDMGTGTGVLAIAAAKTWRHLVQAGDIDAEAVRVARHNARRNGVAPLIRLARAGSYRARPLRRAAPAELVFANILARPLMLMARDLCGVLARDGIVVLSGLLARQESAVLAAHRPLGFRLVRRIPIDGWHTLVLRRGGRAESNPPPLTGCPSP